MSHSRLNLSAARRGRAGPALAVVLLAAAVAAGCAKRDSMVVGAVPDDYRTNHPIVVAERDVSLDIPVGLTDHGLNKVQRAAIDGFASNYDRSAAPIVTILVPTGSANQVAAGNVAAGVAQRLRASGVSEGRILTQRYDARSHGETAPIRVVYAQMRASTGKCGRWPEDLADTTANRHWTNFGCSYQNNLAAQIANPADLLTPRKMTEIDTERRGISIDDYRVRETTWDSEVGIDW